MSLRISAKMHACILFCMFIFIYYNLCFNLITPFIHACISLLLRVYFYSINFCTHASILFCISSFYLTLFTPFIAAHVGLHSIFACLFIFILFTLFISEHICMHSVLLVYCLFLFYFIHSIYACMHSVLHVYFYFKI